MLLLAFLSPAKDGDINTDGQIAFKLIERLTTATEVCDVDPKLKARAVWKTPRLFKRQKADPKAAILYNNSQAFLFEIISRLVQRL